MSVKRLPTYYGVLNYTLAPGEPGTLRMKLSGDIALPRGRIVLRPPLPQPLRAVSVNGKPIEDFSADEVTIGEFPAEVVFRYAEPPTPAAEVAIPAGTN
jgi:hypothetical protein